MIAIDNVLISDELVEEHFVCDLHNCKGGCCVDGDCGAPLAESEPEILQEIFPRIRHLLSERHVAEIERQGTHVTDPDYGDVTPTISGGICVYAYTDDHGLVKCGIEKAWKLGLIDFQKPVSCHLYPARVTKSDGFEAVNFEPRKKLCRPACELGATLRIPVYQFLKSALLRNYGEDFYRTLDEVAQKHFPRK